MSASTGAVTSPASSQPLSLEARYGQLPDKDGQVNGGHDRLGPFLWPHRFFMRQSISRNWENSPWATANVEFTDGTLIPEEPGEEAGIFSLSMEENCPADRSRVAPLVAFLHGARLLELQQGHCDIPTRKIAILIDGNFSENKNKRYSEKSEKKFDTIDAERRLIYAVDLSRWGLLAIIGSAPESLYRVLVDFLLNYVLSRPYIGVHFATEGPVTFAMEFSFPYSVWRTSRTLMQDNRAKGHNKGALRSTDDVTFLRALAGSNTDGESIDAIHSSHMSCLVTGYDQYRWTGILFCETWYEVETTGLPTPDSIARYEAEQRDVEESFGVVKLSDPLRRGKGDMFDSTLTMWRPRAYFLGIFGIRFSQIHRESQVLFHNMYKRTEGIETRHRNLLQRMLKSVRGRQAPGSRADVLDELDNAEEGILLAKGIVRTLARTMEEIVSTGESFLTTDANYFLDTKGQPDDGPDGSSCYSDLSQIRRITTDLRRLRQRFGVLQTRYEEMIKDSSAAKDMVIPLSSDWNRRMQWLNETHADDV
ncbi:hypothetical protein CPAR01_00342 [Colletotrichum paranaense]|uniref:Uncharacterized protein n=1 Tax=Colletotrichum paranaense TaxID=1914294 RepID=A0ABQ9T3N3_9PEZI|nr:uncharacterized protein CPAR01_00342 [Colletotrichum paranaense]KAK1546375.1 hypothetical protein CPAR01_00342 [Colletotrichum paranaense]